MTIKEFYITDAEVVVTYEHRGTTFNIYFDYEASFRGYNVDVAELGSLCKRLFDSPSVDTFADIISINSYIRDISLCKDGVIKDFSKN